MKYQVLIIFILITSFLNILNAQVPQAFKYQAVIRENNQPIDDSSISVNVQIWKYSPEDSMIFEETFYGVSAENGL